MLVGEDHREPVAAGLGQHLVERVGQVQEVLALVDVQAGVDAGGLAQPGPVRWRLCHTWATTNDPSSRAVSSPRMPLGSRTRQTPPSRTSAHVEAGVGRGRRPGGRSRGARNARSLFISGPMTWARLASLIASYQPQKPPRPTVSSATAATTGPGTPSSASSRGMSARLAGARGGA